MSFAKLGVPKWLCEALELMEIRKPSAIQAAAIPKILAGENFIGGAKTGSGKTLAFGAPMLTNWSEDPCGIYGLILTPTRELAIQIAEQFSVLGSVMNIKIAIIVGGEDIVQQALELQRKPHFVIATPGRLADHILNSGPETMSGLKRVKYLVLDEADRLLSSSFENHLKICLDAIPKQRQTLVFTATMTDDVRNLQKKLAETNKVTMHEVEDSESVAIPSTLSVTYISMPQHVKEAYLHSLVSLEKNKKKGVIVFVNRTTTAELIRRTLLKMGEKVTSLHSEMRQSERINSLHRFKAKVCRILIATDLVSRGLDIPTVELVINFDLPTDADDYIHRVGRTARAGRSGESISFVTDSKFDIMKVLRIEKRINKKMDKYDDIDDDTVIKNSLKAVSQARTESMMEMDKLGFGEKRRINEKKHGKKKKVKQ